MRRGFTVLMVDDDPVVREAAVNLLEDLGLAVFDAYNGHDALKLLSEHPEIDLLVADIRMAGVPGTELAIQARRFRPDLRIVLTSGYMNTAPIAEFEFIRKPWRETELRVILGVETPRGATHGESQNPAEAIASPPNTDQDRKRDALFGISLQQSSRRTNKRDWRHLLAYWEGKCVGELLPSRADIDPLIEIPRLASRLLLIDTDRDGYRFRLIGSTVVLKMERDLTGEQIGCGRTPLDGSVPYLGKVERTKAPVLLSIRMPSNDPGHSYLLLLPLINRHDQVAMLLGGVFEERASEVVWSRENIEIAEVLAPHRAIDNEGYFKGMDPIWRTAFTLGR